MNRRGVCFVLQFLTCLSAFGGVFLSLLFATRDGYSHWSKRLLYFTAQSNLWIGIVFLFLLAYRKKPRPSWLALLKFVFTVSITVTGLVFCFLLAPFSDDNYTPWTFCNLLTHVFTPLFAAVDFFLENQPVSPPKNAVFASLLPPFCYCAVSVTLQIFEVDFGRGVPYPYFFLNYRSPARLFGFSRERPFFLGSFYWLALFFLLVLGISVFYAKTMKKRR